MISDNISSSINFCLTCLPYWHIYLICFKHKTNSNIVRFMFKISKWILSLLLITCIFLSSLHKRTPWFHFLTIALGQSKESQKTLIMTVTRSPGNTRRLMSLWSSSSSLLWRYINTCKHSFFIHKSVFWLFGLKGTHNLNRILMFYENIL